MRINIVLPFPATKPVGGAKIMYEYANRLAAKGHDVTVYHSIRRPFKKSSTPIWLKQLIFSLRGVARPSWFPLHKNIQSLIVPAITDRYIRDAEVTMSTWWQMTYAVSELSSTKGKKFNLIQGHEVWSGQEDAVHASYLLPVQHLVIARYLFELFKEKTNGKEPQMLPLAISDTEFRIEQAIEERQPGRIIMLYSDEHWKGSRYGIDALLLVHEKFPDLQVQLFGVPVAPPGLPEWIHYTQKPGNLRELYNQASIFISPSLREGWALPPAEAMACGCAVVCTRIGGHLDYAIDQQTALLSEPENAQQMADKILQLIQDDAYRKQLAQNGHQLMQTKFNWDASVNRLEQYFIQQS